MTSKRKVFVMTNLTIPMVEHLRTPLGIAYVPPELIPPANTNVEFTLGVGGGMRRFDFATWYGIGLDEITYATQRQIERFLEGQDADLSHITIRAYCIGLGKFLDFCSQVSAAVNRCLRLQDINRGLIDGYLMFLGSTPISKPTQKGFYSHTKAVLVALCARGLITRIRTSDKSTFPRNPFPNLHHHKGGEKPLPKAQRQAFSAAIKLAVMPLFSDPVEVTSDLLVCALLIIALHTGRNTWPLLEMGRDCLRQHPKDGMRLLVLYKHRGHSENSVPLRSEAESSSQIEGVFPVRPNVSKLIDRVIELSDRLRSEAPSELKDRIWLYRIRSVCIGDIRAGEITSLTDANLGKTTSLLMTRFKLTDPNGKRLRINVSRLRKTFINRVFELTDGDIVSTAAAAGDTVAVTDINYLRPGENAQRNWKFMGLALVEELLTNTVGASENTPVGRCSDPKNGEHAPKRDGRVCMSFLNCIRCKNYVVTGDDLHRLFSFYWRVLSERSRMPPKRWKKQLGHIVRLIDIDIVEAGIAKGIFKKDIVAFEREKARIAPHPFWHDAQIISDLRGEVF